MKTSSHLWNASRAYRRRRKAEAARRCNERRAAKAKAEAGRPKPEAKRPKPEAKVSTGFLAETERCREAAEALAWRCDGCGRTFRPHSGGATRGSGRHGGGEAESDRLRLGGRSLCEECAKARRRRRRLRDWAESPDATPWPAALRRTAR